MAESPSPPMVARLHPAHRHRLSLSPASHRRLYLSPASHPSQHSPRHRPYHPQLIRSTSSTSLPTPVSTNPSSARKTSENMDELSLSLSDEDMLLSDGDFSDAGGEATGDLQSARSRRLLSAEQSKFLYKILAKTHFPSTQLRETAATQLGVAPRKVQVWFQNRRQVGKKRMMEAVQSFIETSHPSSISLDVLQDQLMQTGKGRVSAIEDERTRAWRRHTIRLALNPAEGAEEEGKVVDGSEPHRMFDLRTQQRGWQHFQPLYGHMEGLTRGSDWPNCRQGGSRTRPPAALSINVPPQQPCRTVPRTTTASHPTATPTYTGPGSATHLEALSSSFPGRPLPPYTPGVTRTLISPAIVSSQKECFSLPPPPRTPPREYYEPQQRQGSTLYARRDRSATLAVLPNNGERGSEGRDGGMKQVRDTLTAEWHAQQRAFSSGYQQQQQQGERWTRLHPSSLAASVGPEDAREWENERSTVSRLRSNTDALSRLNLPPPIPSVRRERYSPYPIPSLRNPSGPLFPADELLSLGGSRRSRSMTFPHPRSPTTRRDGQNATRHPSKPSLSSAATILTSSTAAPHSASTTPTALCSPPNTPHKAKSNDESPTRYSPMDVRSLTTVDALDR